jgi:hypothetical protein
MSCQYVAYMDTIQKYPQCHMNCFLVTSLVSVISEFMAAPLSYANGLQLTTPMVNKPNEVYMACTCKRRIYFKLSIKFSGETSQKE